jgi:catechol 2,3-dioxygenase-like lactoylglutathione lyase family enzyme
MPDAPARPMLGHLSFGVADLARSTVFYDGVLGALGYVRVWSGEHGVGYAEPGENDKLNLFRQSGNVTTPSAGFHLAFNAPDRASIDAFHAAALGAGGSDAGPPGLRPLYGATYYAAFVLDPDGYKLEAVHQ